VPLGLPHAQLEWLLVEAGAWPRQRLGYFGA
jgi:hypothetical protein